MPRIKVDPESKYCLQIAIVPVSEEYMEDHPNDFLMTFSTTEDVVISQNDVDEDIFTVYFIYDDFRTFDDASVVNLINMMMNEIDKITQDPDPHMDLQFAIMDGDITNIRNLPTKFDNIVKLLSQQ